MLLELPIMLLSIILQKPKIMFLVAFSYTVKAQLSNTYIAMCQFILKSVQIAICDLV